jgi:hypothetical protein
MHLMDGALWGSGNVCDLYHDHPGSIPVSVSDFNLIPRNPKLHASS